MNGAALERWQRVEDVVSWTHGGLRVTARRISRGWTAAVLSMDPCATVVGEGEGPDEHAAIAAALHAAGVLAREIDAAGDAWRAQAVGT